MAQPLDITLIKLSALNQDKTMRINTTIPVYVYRIGNTMSDSILYADATLKFNCRDIVSENLLFINQ